MAMTTYSEAVEQTITAGEQIHQIVNGTATTEVTVEDGSKVPSIRKALLDNFYFKDPIAWQVGQTENVFNQLRQFTDGSWWYAPSATASNPVSMGSTPVGDVLWKIYDFDAIGKLTPQIRESLRRSYAEAGYNLVDGSFEVGGTLVNANDVLLQERTGKAFSGPAGTVAAGTNPASGGFVDKSGGLLRHELATSASAISNANGGSVQDFIDAQFTNVTELATGKFQVGQYVRLTDRAMGLFLLQSGGTPDGYSILDAGNGNTAVLDDVPEIDPAWLGANTTGDASLVLQAVLDTGLHIDGKGRKYSAVGLIDSSDLRRISNITLTKSANGTVLSSSGRAPQFSNLLIEGLNGFTGDNWIITGDNADLLNCGSRTDGGGLALRAEGNGTNIIGSKEAYQSVGQPFSIQIGNEITQTLYAKLTGVDTQTGGGIRWVKHGTASIVGSQIGGSTVEFGSYQIWHSNCRFNGDVILNGSGGVESSSISRNLTIGNGTNAISQVTISDDVIVQSGYTVTLNANVRESSINLAQIAKVGGVTIVDNLTGTANDVGNTIYLPTVVYSPNWTADTTQPSIGDGSLVGYYTRSGKTIFVNMTLTWGTTTNGGAGDWFFSVPKASGPYGNSVGSVLALDSGTGYSNGNAILPPSSSLISQYVGPEPVAGRTRFNRPFTWASGDDFKMSLSYQIN